MEILILVSGIGFSESVQSTNVKSKSKGLCEMEPWNLMKSPELKSQQETRIGKKKTTIIASLDEAGLCKRNSGLGHQLILHHLPFFLSFFLRYRPFVSLSLVFLALLILSVANTSLSLPVLLFLSIPPPMPSFVSSLS